MKEDSTLFSVSPDALAQYLEQLNDIEFWNYAYEKAHMPHSTHSSPALATLASPPDDTLTYITCELRTTHCMLPLTLVREILPSSQHITRLPDVPPWMLGILSWRGETIAAIDLCLYITKNDSSPLQNRVFLVIRHEHMSLALCVLSVASIASVVNIRQITPFALSPGTEEGEPPDGLAGVLERDPATGDQILVLDIPSLFKDVIACIEKKDSYE